MAYLNVIMKENYNREITMSLQDYLTKALGISSDTSKRVKRKKGGSMKNIKREHHMDGQGVGGPPAGSPPRQPAPRPVAVPPQAGQAIPRPVLIPRVLMIRGGGNPPRGVPPGGGGR